MSFEVLICTQDNFTLLKTFVLNKEQIFSMDNVILES